MLYPIAIGNRHRGDKGEYVGRGSPLGNPFPITKTNNREVVISKYNEWLFEKIRKNDRAVLDELSRLMKIAQQRPLTLVCYCAPNKCHADLIKNIIEDNIQYQEKKNGNKTQVNGK